MILPLDVDVKVNIALILKEDIGISIDDTVMREDLVLLVDLLSISLVGLELLDDLIFRQRTTSRRARTHIDLGKRISHVSATATERTASRGRIASSFGIARPDTWSKLSVIFGFGSSRRLYTSTKAYSRATSTRARVAASASATCRRNTGSSSSTARSSSSSPFSAKIKVERSAPGGNILSRLTLSIAGGSSVMESSMQLSGSLQENSLPLVDLSLNLDVESPVLADNGHVLGSAEVEVLIDELLTLIHDQNEAIEAVLATTCIKDLEGSVLRVGLNLLGGALESLANQNLLSDVGWSLSERSKLHGNLTVDGDGKALVNWLLVG